MYFFSTLNKVNNVIHIYEKVQRTWNARYDITDPNLFYLAITIKEKIKANQVL